MLWRLMREPPFDFLRESEPDLVLFQSFCKYRQCELGAVVEKVVCAGRLPAVIVYTTGVAVPVKSLAGCGVRLEALARPVPRKATLQTRAARGSRSMYSVMASAPFPIPCVYSYSRMGFFSGRESDKSLCMFMLALPPRLAPLSSLVVGEKPQDLSVRHQGLESVWMFHEFLPH